MQPRRGEGGAKQFYDVFGKSFWIFKSKAKYMIDADYDSYKKPINNQQEYVNQG